MRKRVMWIASAGGHWVQLNRMSRLFNSYDSHLASTSKIITGTSHAPFHIIPDANANQPFKLIRCWINCLLLLVRVRPHLVVTTGAAPGLMMLLAARLLGIPSIWIDSIANSEHLSRSGQLAKKWASISITQWEHLAKPGDVIHIGSLI